MKHLPKITDHTKQFGPESRIEIKDFKFNS